MDSAMRPVVIVFLDPTSDRCLRFFQAAILRRPDFLFLQGLLEAEKKFRKVKGYRELELLQSKLNPSLTQQVQVA